MDELPALPIRKRMQTVPPAVLHERSTVLGGLVYEIGPSAVECQDQLWRVVVDQTRWRMERSGRFVPLGGGWTQASARARAAKLASEQVHHAMHAAVLAKLARFEAGVAHEHVAERGAGWELEA